MGHKLVPIWKAGAYRQMISQLSHCSGPGYKICWFVHLSMLLWVIFQMMQRLFWVRPVHSRICNHDRMLCVTCLPLEPCEPSEPIVFKGSEIHRYNECCLWHPCQVESQCGPFGFWIKGLLSATDTYFPFEIFKPTGTFTVSEY